MMIDVGDRQRLRFENLSPAGDLVDAASMRLTITLPDESTVVVDPVAPLSTGIYEHDFDTTLAGPHTAHWEGTPYGAHIETFNVRPLRTDIISVAAAKRQLNIAPTSTAHDEELRVYVEALTRVLEGPDGLGHAVVKRTETDVRHLPRGAGRIALDAIPVISLDSITDANGHLTWDPADFHLDGETGVVTALDSTARLVGLVEIGYTAGYEVIPGNILMAARVTLQDWWRTQREGGGGPRYVGGSVEIASLMSSGWALPPAARQLLGPALQGMA